MMGLNTQMAAMLGGMDAARIAVEPQRCISVRNRNASCQRCIASCATGALHMEGDEPRVDAGKCMGCGTCANACPTDAITLAHPSAADVEKAVKRSGAAFGGRPVICCSRAAEQIDGFTEELLEACGVCVVPCLGHVDESLLVEQAARKAAQVLLINGSCSSCEHVRGGELAKQVCTDAQALIDAFGARCAIEFLDGWPQEVLARLDADEPAQGQAAPLFDADEEEMLAAVEADTKDDEPSCYWKVADNGTLSHYIPLKRARLFNCLAHLGTPKADEVRTRLAGRISIDAEACMSCRMCAVFCPTGALRRSAEGKPFGLVHRPTLCMQCRCCEQICPKDAIRIEDTLPMQSFLERKAEFIELEEPGWKPNTPESMYDRFADMIGHDLETGHF